MFKKLISFLLMAAVSSAGTQNNGSIAGNISDATSGEALIGANVQIVGTDLGGATDFEGNYLITGLAADHYDIKVSYIAYHDTIIKNVRVNSGITTSLNAGLTTGTINLNSVTIQGAIKRTGAMAVLEEKRNSINVQDGISAEQIARSGDSNAGDALRRVTGVSLVEGKYVYVRGLGERYTNTQMNNVAIPSPEPDKRSVPMNMIPAALIEQINVFKSFSPDLPGSFAGGNVNIKTKAYPDGPSLNVKFGSGTSSNLAGAAAYRLGTRGQYDFWGYDDGTRAFPSAIPDTIAVKKYYINENYQYYYPGGKTSTEWKQELGSYGKTFQSDFSTSISKPKQPLSLAVNGGTKYIINNALEWGYFTNVNFSNKYEYQNSENYQYAHDENSYVATKAIDRVSSGYGTNLGASFSTGFKWRDFIRLDYQNVYTHTSKDMVHYGTGTSGNIDYGIFLNQTYVEKSICTGTTNFSIRFPLLVDHKIDIVYSKGQSVMDQPDSKLQVYKLVDGETDLYRMITTTQGEDAGVRYFTNGQEHNNSYGLDYILTGKVEVKFGFKADYKDREFIKREFYHDHSTWGWPSELLNITESEIGSIFTDENYYTIDDSTGEVINGMILLEDIASLSRNAYSATEDLTAGYVMVRMPITKWSELITGFRREIYDMELIPFNPITGELYYNPVLGDMVRATIDDDYILPSVIFDIDLPWESKIRASASRTVARPQFREVAPYDYQEFYGGEMAVGYPYLKTTRITNYDLRFERYPSAGENFMFGWFRKDFKNPIDVAAMLLDETLYKNYQNAISASSWGLEAEARVKIPLIPIQFGYGHFNFNVIYTQSEVVTDSIFILFDGSTVANSASNLERPLLGQSDWVVNLGLSLNTNIGTSVGLAYNSFSKRLSSVGGGALNDEYEYPFHSLNFTADHTFSNHYKVSLKVNNMLDSEIIYGMENPDNGERYITKTYKPGVSYSLGISYKM